LKSLLRLGVALALLAVIVWKLGGVAPIVATLSRIQPAYVALLIGIAIADRALMAYKWLRLLGAQGVRLSFPRGFAIYCVSSFWGQVLPMTVGGDMVRLWLTTRAAGRGEAILASIAMERLLGFIAALLTGLVGLLVLGRLVDLGPGFTRLWWVAIAVIVAGIAALLLTMSQTLFDHVHARLPARLARVKVVERLRQTHQACVDYRRHGATLWSVGSLTLIEQFAPILFLWCTARALRVDLGFMAAIGIAPLATLITRIPISLGGIGVLEGSFMVLLPRVGVSPATAVSMALVDRAITVAAMFPWWMAFTLANRSITLPASPIDTEPPGRAAPIDD
jgi:uncharacterized protein (TIRG00374 family)